MLKRHELQSCCPIELALLLVGNRYKAIIIIELLNGKKRFTELKNLINGISQKVLTDHLRIMEEYGAISREVYAEVPPRVEYSLTELGLALKPIIDDMIEWGENYKATHCEKLKSTT